MSAAAAAKTAFWRVAGLDFPQYQNLAGRAVRAALKEPLRTQAKSRDVVHFRERKWNAGVKSEPVVVSSIVTGAKAKA